MSDSDFTDDREKVGNGEGLPAPPQVNVGDITRTNPYPDTSTPNVPGAINMPPAVISQPRVVEALGTGQAQVGPLSNNDKANYDVRTIENRKEINASQAENMSHDALEIARINREAEAEVRRNIHGNPQELLNANKNLEGAQAMDPNDPKRQQLILDAQTQIELNKGARPLLAQAMADATNRDVALRAEIQKARAEKIDPDHWWNEKSTGAKILAGVGMILGGAGGGLGRTGRNPAMDVMNSAIQNDMDSQRHHIDNHFKSLVQEQNLNNDAFTRDAHRQTWEQNYRSAAMEHMKLSLAQAAATTQSETVKNNAMLGIQDLTDQQMVIRNKQYQAAVALQQAEINRMRALSKEANIDVQKLQEKDGVSYQDAMDAVYSRPYYKGLIGSGMAPPEQAQKAMQRLEAGRREEQLKQNGMSKEEARAVVTKEFPDAFKTLGIVVPQAAGKSGGETAEQIQGRSVFVDGKQTLAINKKAADDWISYGVLAPEAQRLVTELKANAPKAVLYGKGGGGDPAKYNQARGQLLEVLPKIYGYNRGPSETQARTSFGPETIPEYAHVYTDFMTGGVQSERAMRKLDGLQATLDTVDKGMRQSTFGDTSDKSASNPAPAPAAATAKGPPKVTDK